MLILSMTGYGNAVREFPTGAMSLEVKSVNSRFLDVVFRLNDELRASNRRCGNWSPQASRAARSKCAWDSAETLRRAGRGPCQIGRASCRERVYSSV